MPRPKGSKNKPKAPRLDGGPSAKSKAPKPSKAAMAGDNASDKEEEARQELFREYKRKLGPALARLEAAKKTVNEIYADAKGYKLPKKLFKLDQELNGTPVQEQKAIQRVHDTAWVAKATGHTFAEQLELFAQEPTRIKPWNEGQEASAANKPLKNPYAPGTKDHDEFNAGYYAHQESIAKGIKPLKNGGGKTVALPDGPLPDDEAPWPDDDADPSRPLAH
jgi:hypothetical protein